MRYRRGKKARDSVLQKPAVDTGFWKMHVLWVYTQQTLPI